MQTLKVTLYMRPILIWHFFIFFLSSKLKIIRSNVSALEPTRFPHPNSFCLLSSYSPKTKYLPRSCDSGVSFAAQLPAHEMSFCQKVVFVFDFSYLPDTFDRWTENFLISFRWKWDTRDSRRAILYTHAHF